MRLILRALNKAILDGWRVDITGSEQGGWDVMLTCIGGARGRSRATAKTLEHAVAAVIIKIKEKWGTS